MKHIYIFILAPVLIFSSCKKEFDTPPVKPAETLNKINIANIKSKYMPNINYRFKGDSSLYCVITADESSGNLYKELFVKDVTGALHVRLINSGGLYTGDSIRINLKGAILNENNKLIQLDSVDSENNVVKLASGYDPQPLPLTLAQIVANTSATNTIQSKLVKLENVEFIAADQNKTFADATGRASLTRVIRSCSGQTLAVRTSGYCSFANKTTPSRNGSVVGIISQYENNMQLILRNYSDLQMTGALCSATTPTSTAKVYLKKDFDDNSISSGGWISYTVTNSAVNWSAATFSGTPTPFAKISGYSGSSNTASETWLISPPIDLSAAINPVVSFQTAAKYTGPLLDVLVSANYTNGSPSTAVWTSLPGTSLSSGNFAWTTSGNVILSAYRSAKVRLAFKYSSTATAAATYELDDIVVREN